MGSSIFIYLQQLKALEAIFENGLQYHERKIRRAYSREFNTPLMDVYALPYEFVLQQYYENAFEKMTPEQLIEISSELIPELKQEQEKTDQAYADSLIKLQEESLKKHKQKTAVIPPVELKFDDDENIV